MSRPLYLTLDQVTAQVPLDIVTGALDDDADGEIDTTVWDEVAGGACNAVDGILGQRYAVPFAASPDTPALVHSAALIFLCETLYLRRGYGDEKTNPFLTRATRMRAKLDDIAAGRAPLTPTAERPRQSVNTVTEPARTSSAAGSLAT